MDCNMRPALPTANELDAVSRKRCEIIFVRRLFSAELKNLLMKVLLLSIARREQFKIPPISNKSAAGREIGAVGTHAMKRLQAESGQSPQPTVVILFHALLPPSPRFNGTGNGASKENCESISELKPALKIHAPPL
jgi:hypothetical protein